MKLENLEGKSREEQSQLIADQPKVATRDMIDNPDKMQGKILVFCGNYAGFETEGLCVRKFEYLEQEGRWKVSDTDLSKMRGIEFSVHFTASELRKQFEYFCDGEVFLLEK